MIVSEPATAAVARGPGGEEARFDDLACLAGFARERGTAGWRIWVHVVDEQNWVESERARYLRDPHRVTPMGSGWTAVSATADGAPEAAVEWPELIRLTEERQ